MSKLGEILAEVETMQGLIAYAVVEIESGNKVEGKALDPNFPLEDACSIFANVVRTWSSCFQAVNAGKADIAEYCTDQAAVVTRVLPDGKHYLGFAIARSSLEEAKNMALKLTDSVSKNL